MARKRGMQFIPYDYEAAYNKAMEDMHEWFIENLFQHRKKVIYALKEITAGDQFEIEIYPQFRSMDEVPPEGRTIKKDNNKAQKNLNDKNARKYVERLINENFSDRDIWMTLTYDDAHLPPDGDVDAAIKNVQKYIRRINYQRKKRGLPNAKYVYVTAYNPDAEIRWHHHIVMDGALDMETVESCWKQSSRNEVRRLQTDENGLSGMANYIVEEIKGIVSATFTGIKDTMNSLMSTANTLTGGKLDSIKSAFSSKLASAKSTASSAMENIKSSFSSKMESAHGAVTGALSRIKSAFNFKWSLPHLNLPHISVSGGKAPYGIGGKGSLPSFSIQWYKSGGIMTNPTVFGINGNSLMVGGEAGDEAILPLAEFYNKLNNILDKKLDAVQKSNIVYVTNHTYIDGDEVASRTVSRVDAQMVTDKRKGR